MTAPLSLAAAMLILTLPSVPVIRADALARNGRLSKGPMSTRGRVSAGSGLTRLVQFAVATVVLLVVLDRGFLLGIATAAMLATGVLLASDLRRRRAAARLRQEMVTVVGVLAGELVAGAQPTVALEAAAGVGTVTAPVFATAAKVAGRGGDASALLIEADVTAVRSIGFAWQLVETTGAALAQVMERVAGDLAAQTALSRAVAVALAGPRSSAALLSTLPLVGIALGAAMGAHPLALLFDDPLGRALCCAGVLLDVAGVLWIREIVRRAEPR